MSKTEGDALRNEAAKLRTRASDVVAVSNGVRAEWATFGQALSTEEANAQAIASSLNASADALEAQAAVVDGLEVPAPVVEPQFLVKTSLWEPTFTTWVGGPFKNWGVYANTYASAGSQMQDAVSLDKNARVEKDTTLGYLLCLDLKKETYAASGSNPAFSYTGVSLRTPPSFGPGDALEYVVMTPLMGRYATWSAAGQAGDDSEIDAWEQFSAKQRWSGGGTPSRRMCAIKAYKPSTVQNFVETPRTDPGWVKVRVEWACVADPANIVYFINDKIVHKVPKSYLTNNVQDVLIQAQCGGTWDGGKYADPGQYGAPVGSGLPTANSTAKYQYIRILKDNPKYVKP